MGIPYYLCQFRIVSTSGRLLFTHDAQASIVYMYIVYSDTCYNECKFHIEMSTVSHFSEYGSM